MFNMLIKFLAKVKFNLEKRKYEYSELKSMLELPRKDDLFKSLNETDLLPVPFGVAIYARTANDEDNELAKQVSLIAASAETVGDKNYVVYSETVSGLSKGKKECAELYRFMADAEKGLIKRVYIKSRDRLARDFVFERETAEKLNNWGVELIEVG